ncbi:hypothetical protein ERJ70_06235 [Sediminibacillus dalangtanensis]|uniref:ABC-2 family transporter protein n=1 Tax=Sediminibacillus dalangtanensis TaxID=2729421 RepID=A0ABX7VSZ9_9BACI|nr:hypothetical protein [Sediminibacillus dalangtanensis]QTM98935.1 hypothetical protein ERJ70_06235 [Sediminibacillus dalangtanensis]
MKQSNVWTITRKGIASLGSRWFYVLIYFLLIILGLTFSVFYNSVSSEEGLMEKVGVLDLVVFLDKTSGTTNHSMLTFLAIPLIVSIVHLLVQYQERSNVILKIGSRFTLWQTHAAFAFIVSFVLTVCLLIVSYVLSGLIVGFDNTWITKDSILYELLGDKQLFPSVVPYVSTGRVLTIVFVTKFLSFLLIFFLALFLKRFIKNIAIIFIILLAMSGLDRTGMVPFEFFTFFASLSLEDWLHPVHIYYKCFYLFVLSLFLYGITGLLYEKKDFLQ